MKIIFIGSFTDNGKGKLECVKNDCADYDQYANYDSSYGYKCGNCHPVNIARDWVINGFGVAKDGFYVFVAMLKRTIIMTHKL